MQPGKTHILELIWKDIKFSGDRYPEEINSAMKKVWFAYGDLGYDGVNGGRAKRAIENLDKVLKFFEKRFCEQIEA